MNANLKTTSTTAAATPVNNPAVKQDSVTAIFSVTDTVGMRASRFVFSFVAARDCRFF